MLLHIGQAFQHDAVNLSRPSLPPHSNLKNRRQWIGPLRGLVILSMLLGQAREFFRPRPVFGPDPMATVASDA